MMEQPEEFNRLLEEWLTKSISTSRLKRFLHKNMKINTAEF
jgi:hypothetical protein